MFNLLSNCRFIIISLFLLTGLLTGCSQLAYDALQQRELEKCHEKLGGAEFDRCLEMHSESYEDYQRERQKILQEAK